MFLKVEDGALTEAPVHESHPRGKNWLATISSDPTAPAGLARTFHTKARGRYYYMTDQLKSGDAVEFGADYYTGGGRKHPNRWYGVVLAVTEDHVEIEPHTTANQAIKATAGKAKEELV